MQYYDSIGVPKGTDVNKTSESKECDIFHCWFFLDKRFKFHQDVCSGCYDVLLLSMNLLTLNLKEKSGIS